MKTDTATRGQREKTLAFQSARLADKLKPFQARSRALAFVRLGIALVAVAAVVASILFGSPLLTWAVALVGLGVFIGAVLVHRRLEGWIETLTLWRAQKLDRLARMRLDWDELPPPRPIELRDKSLARDLDLIGVRSLHQLLDTTISRRGTQLLAEWLTTAQPDLPASAARRAVVRELAPRSRFRDRFQLTYRLTLKRELEGDNLLEWFKSDFPSRRLARALPLAALLVALNLILFALWYFAGLPPVWIVSLVAYIAFYYWNQGALENVLGAIVRVNTELEKFRALVLYLERARYDGAPQLAALCAPFRRTDPAPSQQLRQVGLVTTGVGLRANPFLALLLNLFLPWDFLFAFLGDRQRQRVAAVLPEWVRVVQQLDALIALGNFAWLNPEAAFPEIAPDAQPVLAARALGHPLIPHAERVCNDFEIAALGEVKILTGSNMAGKSTFLKTLGVNLMLAYAGAPVIAASLRARPMRVHTCIRISDSITDGFSFFYAEVKCLRALREELQAADALPLFYLIDEIFRGTNNRERLIGSRSFIHTLLGAHGAGLIATHDLELAHLADQSPLAQNLHFRDAVRDGRLVFDYLLRPGPCPTTNALKIMELEGLPVEWDGDGKPT